MDAVVSPAMGGLIIGQEVARALPERKGVRAKLGRAGGGVPAIFVERDAAGTDEPCGGDFRCGMAQRVLVMEDVWTTGGSTREAIRVVESKRAGAWWRAGALIDRSGWENRVWAFLRKR